jgi:hypothetical protein
LRTADGVVQSSRGCRKIECGGERCQGRGSRQAEARAGWKARVKRLGRGVAILYCAMHAGRCPWCRRSCDMFGGRSRCDGHGRASLGRGRVTQGSRDGAVRGGREVSALAGRAINSSRERSLSWSKLAVLDCTCRRVRQPATPAPRSTCT